MTNLLTLAAQIEQATEDQQREMLEATWLAIFPQPPIGWERPAWANRWRAFRNMLDAKAYESAAMMLVPEGYDWDMGTERNRGSAFLNKGDNFSEEIFATTPALALAAACCRAVAQMGEG